MKIYSNKYLFKFWSYGLIVSHSFLIMSCQAVNTSSSYQSESKVEFFKENIPKTSITFDMILVQEGNFNMGSSKSEQFHKNNEEPQHKVSLDAFWIGKYEVTWEIFELFLSENQKLFQKIEGDKQGEIDAISRPSPPYEDPSYGMGKEGFPAVSMSAYSALVFCKWLSTITGRFYRLPTEAEWEYACKAGGNETFSFGNSIHELGKYAVYYENSNGSYAKSGSKLPNAWGIYDMHGNVSEWTLDEYKEDTYELHKLNNPWVVPTKIYPRVIRGGSWDDDPEDLRSSARRPSSKKLQKRDPQIPKSFWWNTDSPFLGFRLVSPKKVYSKDEQKKFWQIVLDE